MNRLFRILTAALLVFIMLLTLTACKEKDISVLEKTEDSPDKETSSAEEKQDKKPEDKPDDLPKGVEWPDNEWTQQVPKPPFTVGSFKSDDSGTFTLYFLDATYETVKEYVATLKEYGYATDPTAMTLDNGKNIGWVGYNTEGGNNQYGGYDEWLVIITSESNGIMDIIKPG